MFLIKNCTSAVPHNITLFVEFEITIVAFVGLVYYQRSKVLPVDVIPCVCFGTPASLCELHISGFSLVFKSKSPLW